MFVNSGRYKALTRLPCKVTDNKLYQTILVKQIFNENIQPLHAHEGCFKSQTS